MKILIYYKEDLTHRHEFTVMHVSSLESLFDMYPDEDIEGEILPSARKNPELEQILMRIWEQKYNLWLKNIVSTQNLFSFKLMLKDKFGINLPL